MEPADGPLARARHWYTTAAVIVLNFILLCVAINVSWALIHRLRHPVDPTLPGLSATLVNEYGDVLRAVYPHRSAESVRALLAETWSRNFEYEAFTGFREPPFHGTYVNITARGYRSNGTPQEWPPSRRTVFLFGGSTTFGYGVADNETIGAELGRQIAQRDMVSVYNFGRASYYSGQEQVFFERLLLQGYKPTVAVFLDGYNEFFQVNDEPAFTRDIGKRFNAPPPRLSDYLGTFAAVVGVRAFVARFRPRTPAEPMSVADFDHVIDHYLAHVKATRAMAVEYGVRPVFIWQPVPGSSQPLTRHPFFRNDAPNFGPAVRGYERARQRRKEIEGADVRWCADLASPEGEPMWVDWAHYSAEFNQRVVAACVLPAVSASMH